MKLALFIKDRIVFRLHTYSTKPVIKYFPNAVFQNFHSSVDLIFMCCLCKLINLSFLLLHLVLKFCGNKGSRKFRMVQYRHLQYTKVFANADLLSLFIIARCSSYWVQINISELLNTVVQIDNVIPFNASTEKCVYLRFCKYTPQLRMFQIKFIPRNKIRFPAFFFLVQPLFSNNFRSVFK